MERTLLGGLPSLRPAIGPVHVRTVDRLRTVHFGSARYSVPGSVIGERVEVVIDGPELVVRHADDEIARHRLVSPGEMSLVDDHYGRLAQKPSGAVHSRTPAEIASLSIGPVAEAFLSAAAASGATSTTPWSSPMARASGCARPGHGAVVAGRSPETPRGVGISSWPSGGLFTWPLTQGDRRQSGRSRLGA